MTWPAQGYVYNKAGTALVGITVNAYRIDTGALAGTTTTVGASAGPPPKGAGYWIISGLDTALEYRIEIIFNASQKIIRSRFNAEMGTLTVFDTIYLPVDTAIFINGSALNTVYAKLASPAFTGTVTMAANGLNVGSGQLQVTGGNVTMSGSLTVGTNLVLSAGAATLPSNGLNVGSGQLQVSGGNVSMSGALTVTGEASITTIQGASATKTNTVANNTLTDLPFDSEQFDQGAIHDNVTNNTRMTVGKTGVYLITGSVGFSVTAGDIRQLNIKVNGTGVVFKQEAATAAGGGRFMTTAAILYLTAGDYVQLETYQNSGSSDAGVLSRFAVMRLAGI